ncbi:hypothetical protein [Thermoleptolyngbya sp. M55_K2018_002]|uniref:hypothetical protein n=1 Tax=Thermoleptolyngbya sp. M55_K2018_002 TaxID=2747808 RepID=UPI0019FF95A9|nr:hypothetical protein [Thermoleptolyngbya sp. M55_K2018_002]HIK40603.1 hypothetical protein [Thermoleptolyngbya sp. M55_K2018_002]
MTSERLLQLPLLESGDRLFAKGLAAVLVALRWGIAISEHQAFVASFQQAAP